MFNVPGINGTDPCMDEELRWRNLLTEVKAGVKYNSQSIRVSCLMGMKGIKLKNVQEH